MKLNSFEIKNFKGIGHVTYHINGNSEFQIVGDFCSGKTTVCDAFRVVRDLINGTLEELPKTNDAILKISADDCATYEVQLNQTEIINEKYSMEDAQQAFTNKLEVLTMNEISNLRFRFGKYKLCGHSPLNQTEIDYINSICKSVSPDLYLRKVIDNGQKDNYCEFIFKSRLVEDYSSNVRMILAALMFFKIGDVLVLDDVPYPVIKVIKEHMPKNKQLIYTCYSHNICCDQF